MPLVSVRDFQVGLGLVLRVDPDTMGPNSFPNPHPPPPQVPGFQDPSMGADKPQRSLHVLMNRLVQRLAEGATVAYGLLLLLRLSGVFPLGAGRLGPILSSLVATLLFLTLALALRRWRRRPGAHEWGWMAMMATFALIPLLRMRTDPEPLRLASNLVVLPMAGIFIQRRLPAALAIGVVLGSAILQPFLLSVSRQALLYYSVLLTLSLSAGIFMHLMMRAMLHRVARLLHRLRLARGEIHELAGFLPICAWCKSVRDDEGYWQQVEAYLGRRSKLSFTHGMCPGCRQKVEAEFEAEFQEKAERQS